MTSDAVLDIFRSTRALLSGHFELRSGLHSDQFFQCALLLQHPRLAEQLCAALHRRIVAAGLPEPRTVISPAMGGLFVGHELGRAYGVRHIFAEKQDDRLVLRRGFKIEPGETCLVAEDVITRGGRIQETIDIVEARGGVVAGVAVLVDRSAGKVKLPLPLYSLVQMAPVTWAPEHCPLCKQGMPIEHPGS
jgi:orotate phosphoribosyltransferase